MIADCSSGISASACSTVLAQYVSHLFSIWEPELTIFQLHQATARQRGSIVAPGLQPAGRHRADSGGITRLRSDSEKTEKSDGDIEQTSHPIEPRSRTALLPPIMVSRVTI
jgi:hypothetical protein